MRSPIARPVLAALLLAGAPAPLAMAADGATPLQQVAAVPTADAPATATAGVARGEVPQEVRTALALAGDSVRCDVIDRTLAAPAEHPAYDAYAVLCDCAGGRGELVTVRLMQSGRVAVRAEGTVSLGGGNTGYRAF